MKIVNRAVERIFVDSLFWHRHWHCHRMHHRSFTINNRQFHICSRCTGIVCGIAISPLGLIAKDQSIIILAIFATATFIDGAAQLALRRESLNSIRFITGLMAPPATLAILAKASSIV